MGIKFGLILLLCSGSISSMYLTPGGKNLETSKVSYINQSYKCEKVFRGHQAEVISMTYIAPNKVASVSSDNVAIIWDIEINEPLFQLYDVSFVLDIGRRALAVIGNDNVISILDSNTGEILLLLDGHKGPITSLICYDSSIIVSGSKDKTVRVWYLDEFGLSDVFSFPEEISSVVYLGDEMGAVSFASTIRVLDLIDGTVVSEKDIGGCPTNLIALSDDKVGYFCSLNKTVKIFEIEKDRIAAIRSKNSSRELIALGSGKFLYVCHDYLIKVFDSSILKFLDPLFVHGESKKIKTITELNFNKVAIARGSDIIIYGKKTSKLKKWSELKKLDIVIIS